MRGREHEPFFRCSAGGAGGGGFAWQWPMPAHQKSAVAAYLRSQADAGTLPPPMSFNKQGRAYPDISAVAVEGHLPMFAHCD